LRRLTYVTTRISPRFPGLIIHHVITTNTAMNNASRIETIATMTASVAPTAATVMMGRRPQG
jgi:hypothetical protein